MGFFEMFKGGNKSEEEVTLPPVEKMEEHAAAVAGETPATFPIDETVQPGESVPYEAPDVSNLGEPTQERGERGPADGDLAMPAMEFSGTTAEPDGETVAPYAGEALTPDDRREADQADRRAA